MKLNSLIVATLCLFLISCNTLKKRCEQTNWFDYGQQLGLTGKYPDSDPFYNECRKAEAGIAYGQLDSGFKAGRDHYCTAEGATKVGRDGLTYNYKMCEGGTSKSILENGYKTGLAVYCKPENAFEVGRNGANYLNVCNPEQEKAFLPQYKKGRKIWLAAKVDERRSKANEIRREISDNENQLRHAESQLSFSRGKLMAFKAMNPAAPADSSLEEEVRSHESRGSDYRNRIDSQRTELKKVEDEARKYELELRTLD